MRTVAFLHQKGGTGKTTLAIATAMALAEQDARVLLLDADVQATASEWASRWGERFRVVTRSQIQPIVHGHLPDLRRCSSGWSSMGHRRSPT